MTSAPACRFCEAPLRMVFADLGTTPMSNAFIAPERANAMEPTYPLLARVCQSCRLVQLDAFEAPDAIFSDYIYFSSYSESWLRHAAAYAEAMTTRFGLSDSSLVVEIASNDGYLLQYFHKRGIDVLGIEPAANVAAVAMDRCINTDVAFFGRETARRLRKAGLAADLMAANNVLAHVPDINDFAAGFAILLKDDGVVTFEFPHLMRLMQQVQFDTIYHEHFSYLSLHFVQRLLEKHGLRVFDVEELPTHGGSLRVFACPRQSKAHATEAGLHAVLAAETAAGLESDEAYGTFARQVVDAKCSLLEFLIGARREGKTVAGYGAPAKGNTLLNYCGVGPELLPFTVDRSPHKQGMLLPGTRIPVRSPDDLLAARPDYVLILPWNLAPEVMQQMAAVRGWGGQFVVPVPVTRILP